MKYTIILTMEQGDSPSRPKLRDVRKWAERIKKLTENWTGLDVQVQDVKHEE